ncbi:hypothetical protein K1719_021394 [Acacia pycnantha]|nr:hypothetical protein K1719_021394 [Acacia pycnantha]
MASTYFHGGNSEIQPSGDGLQTLYLMNPTYVPYSDTTSHHHPTTPNMLFFNPNTSPSPHAPNLPHAPPPPSRTPHHHLLGVIPTNMVGSENSEIAAFHGFASAATSAAPRVHNLWGSIIDHQQTPSSPVAVLAATTPSSSGMADTAGFRRPSQQGLSLSLSSQHTAFNRSLSGEADVPGQGQSRVSAISPTSHVGGGGNDMQILGNSPTSSSVSNGIPSMQSAILGSKYLKAAQELLDEVVNVGKGIEKRGSMEIEASSDKEKMKMNKSSESEFRNIGGDGGSSGGKQASELSTAQRQELQMKKSKLVSMLEEVEQRYRQYRHQMQILISSFEQAAGYGAAKSYTALALETISKQFRCLKDAVSCQIKATSKSLGEDDYLGAKVQGSRLRYVDHHLRQQRALQQLGMIQHNAWRPQRGLPERAVSILRAWLFEHFLHPYPKDSDKVMLAKQTGLTRSQVSNWFINARVRLWKPMVEEMYLEETKEQNNESNPKDNNTNRSSKESNKDPNNNEAHEESGSFNIRSSFEALQSKTDHHQTSFNNQTTITNSLHDLSNHPNDPMGVANVSMDMEMKPRFVKDGYNNPLLSEEGYGGLISMQDIGRFNVSNVSEQHLAPRFHGNGVSLTLGLPHQTDNLSLSATQHHGFLSHNIHLGTDDATELCAINAAAAAAATAPPPSSHSGATTSYESIDIQNRKSFAAQLLPDFVT